MSRELVLLFPGQGSQKPGMGEDVAGAFPAARDVFDRVDEALGTSLSRLCFAGPADELTLTHNAQPALFAHGAALWAVLREAFGAQVRAAAGHSLGEFTAYHAAGALGVEQGARLVRRRGELMYEAGVARPGAMAALLGDLGEPVEALCERASRDAGEVVPANYNSPGQLVVSGEVAGVERVMELAKAAGAKRAVRLNVSGAFHSPLMRPAADGLADALAEAGMGAPAFPVASNVTADLVTEAGEARALLVRQLTSPVRWTELVRTLAIRYPDALFVELGPGNVLAGLVKRIAPELSTAACGTAADVEHLLHLA
ncbi:MAG TPA: ACP S-malonyltransferase [Gemmatimonadaceae bacterium]|nr:ACP S-malonyltransferase [Gemmatimonadaceae bacterium]